MTKKRKSGASKAPKMPMTSIKGMARSMSTRSMPMKGGPKGGRGK